MNSNTLTNVNRVRNNLRPHLPKKSSNQGKSCGDLQNACDNFIAQARSGESPDPDPYSSDFSRRQKIGLSEDLGRLAGAAQLDFQGDSNSDAPLRTHQLSESLSRMGHDAQDKLDAASTERSELRKNYTMQVAKTIGWMAAAGGSLLLGLALPVLSVPLVGFTTVKTVQSIAKSRTANKEMAAKQPPLDKEIGSQRAIVADAQKYGSAVTVWDQALAEPKPMVSTPPLSTAADFGYQLAHA